MATFFLTDKNGIKHSFTEQQLQELATRGRITPNTPLETDTGHKGLAGQIPGLTFNAAVQPPFTQPVHVPPPPTAAAHVFCTNCGNAVSEQAVACMSCGARPTGHKKFCRHCGVALNPEQVVCVKCGASLTGTSGRSGGGSTGTPMKVNPQILQITTFAYIGLMMLGVAMGLLTQLIQIPLLAFISVFILILVCGVFAFLMFQFWNLVPRDIARTTPGKAAWFSLIPFFSYYWLFVCLWGLGKDINRTLEQRGIDSRANEMLLLGYCICVLAEFCVGFVIGFLGALVPGEAVFYLSLFSSFLFIVFAIVKSIAIYHLYTSSQSLVDGNEEYRNPSNSVPVFVGIGVVLLVLVLVGVGISLSGSGGSFGGKKTVSVAKAYVEAVIQEEASILDLDSGWSTDDFHEKNSAFAFALSDKKKDGKLVAKQGFEHTWELASKLLFHKLTLEIYSNNASMSVILKNKHREKIRELIGLSIEEIERADGQSNVFDNWKSGGVWTARSRQGTLAYLKMLAQAVDCYTRDIGQPPTTEQGLVVLTSAQGFATLVFPPQPVEAIILPPIAQVGLAETMGVARVAPPLKGWQGPYINETAIPIDPWGNEYRYTSPGKNNRAFDIWSLGPDGRNGTDDDIGHWMTRTNIIFNCHHNF